MRHNINFYLEGEVKDQIGKMSAIGSPFKATVYSWQESVFLMRDRHILDKPFSYRNLVDTIQEIPMQTLLHEDAQIKFQFTPKSWLHYYRCSLTPKKEEEFKKIMNFLSSQEIASYLTYTSDRREERLIIGKNPKLPEI